MNTANLLYGVVQLNAIKIILHPNQKLMTRLIEASSNVGDTVFDPCMGSGAVGVAAKLQSVGVILLVLK